MKRRRKKRREREYQPAQHSCDQPSALALDRELFCAKFAESAWVRLSGISWSHWIAGERGLLFLDLTQAEALTPDTLHCEAQFIAVGRPWPAQFAEFEVDGLNAAINAYHPAREIALGFLFPGEQRAEDFLTSFVFGREPSPPVAFLMAFPDSLRSPADRSPAARAVVINN